MVYHVLNGDALVNRFNAGNFDGEMVVARECLIEGDLSGDSLQEFWQNRANYLAAMYHDKKENYFKEVVPQFTKLLSASDTSEFNLWFGYDLFCRTNMWFVISLLQTLNIQKEVFAIYPSFLPAEDIWKDFGSATVADMITAFQNRIHFSTADLKLGEDLWKAYKANDLVRLEKLSKKQSPCFPYLEQVCKAHIDRFPHYGRKGRPETVIKEIIDNKVTGFYDVFDEFFKREGVYGFGDAQVKQIYDWVVYNQY